MFKTKIDKLPLRRRRRHCRRRRRRRRRHCRRHRRQLRINCL